LISQFGAKGMAVDWADAWGGAISSRTSRALISSHVGANGTTFVAPMLQFCKLELGDLGASRIDVIPVISYIRAAYIMRLSVEPQSG
jgi:hypothetical protein